LPTLCTEGFLAAVSYGHDEGAVAEATEIITSFVKLACSLVGSW